MTLTISISDFRNNISSYLEKVTSGTNVIIRDEKKNIDVAQIIGANSFQKADYEAVLRSSAGIFSDKHAEWADSNEIDKWLTSSRSEGERSFT